MSLLFQSATEMCLGSKKENEQVCTYTCTCVTSCCSNDNYRLCIDKLQFFLSWERFSVSSYGNGIFNLLIANLKSHLIETKLKTISYVVPSNDPSSNCDMRLAPDFILFLKWQMSLKRMFSITIFPFASQKLMTLFFDVHLIDCICDIDLTM